MKWVISFLFQLQIIQNLDLTRVRMDIMRRTIKHGRCFLICHSSLLCMLFFFTADVRADLSDFAGQYNSELEERAAIANQQVYNQLKAAGCSDVQSNPSDSCGGLAFIAWQNVRELVHTANELSGSGPTVYSLRSDLEGLGFALRWTAGEEFAAHGNLSNGFVGSQIDAVASRIAVIRFGATGFSLHPHSNSNILIAADMLGGETGGAAGGDQEYTWSPWGSFLNVNFSYGDGDPTEKEDAFESDGVEFVGGVDYRFDNQSVVGVLLGVQEQAIDFDSTLSIVEGDVEMNGVSLQPFFFYQGKPWYANVSVGYHAMSFDMDRRISYPSFNPDIESTNTIASSKVDADAMSVATSAGWPLVFKGRMRIEPGVSINWRNVRIDDYLEEDLNQKGFNFEVEEQDYHSIESALGVQVSYVFTPRYAVLMPYVDARYKVQHKDDPRIIRAYYYNAGEALSDRDAASFALPTNAPDSEYQVYTLGLSAVLQGASASSPTAAAQGGISGFMNYKKWVGLDFYSLYQISAGVRYEF